MWKEPKTVDLGPDQMSKNSPSKAFTRFFIDVETEKMLLSEDETQLYLLGYNSLSALHLAKNEEQLIFSGNDKL